MEYVRLGDIGKFYGGLTGKSKDDFKDGNCKFVTYKNVYSNPALDLNPIETVRIGENEKQRVLEYGDIIFTGSSETPDECGFSSVVTEVPSEKLYLNSFCFIFRLNDVSILNPNYAKHIFRSHDLRIQIKRTASGVTRFNVSKDKMAKVIIPLPPLTIQEEIVRILDSFTSLTAELQAELQARKNQYKFYLNSFFESIECEKVTLSSLGTLKRGKRFVHADDMDSGVPCIHYGELYTYYGVYADTVKTHIREELREKCDMPLQEMS